MRDYEELVERLKICPDYNDGCKNCPHEHDLGCRSTTMGEAADAIEDLLFFTRRLEELRRDGWHLQRTVSDMYGCCIQQMDIPKPTKEDDNA